MEVRVLGAIEVLDPGPVPIGGPAQHRTLGMLVVDAGGVVSVDRLVEGVWPNGDTPAQAEQTIRKYVHRLRSSLGDSGERIETVGSGYRLRVERDELDASRFEDLVDEARAAAARGESARADDLLEQALGLWRGRPYDEVADLDWARAEVARLEELRATAIDRRFELRLDDGRHTEVIGPLQEAVAEEPFRERRRAQLAVALYRAGRQAEALRAIQDFRAELADELGLNPSPEVDELEHRILEHDPGLLPASHQRHQLRGYELDEVIGEGAFSLVWRGTQPALNRTVAVKQIRAELANQPEFIRRFETEAQTVAALEHPHIVPLYDYWREPDSAYLVMRHVAGGSLESEVLTHRLDEARLRRMIEQVGAALQTAHRAGVIHRDVKSANVLLDGESNFFLTDFGIAFTGADDDEVAASLSTGSPAYASPEQLRRQSLDQRTDVYGFGITIFEAATGRLPFVDASTQAALITRQLEDPVPAPSSVEPSVPAWVDEVVARATAKNPGDRYTSMAELMAAVPAVVSAGADHASVLGGATVIGQLVNPFKALRAFREADAADFHGRERLIARFVEVLARPGSDGRMLAVVGPSGSGKSSAVRSGLLPQLRRGAVPGSDHWFITMMLPGQHPFDELESALTRVAVRAPGPLVELMRDDPRGVARAVRQVLPDEESELLVVIDQFEELFTHATDDERERFLDGLLDAVREPRARLRVVVTVRADFWDRPLRHPGLAARLETAAVTVSPLAADELEAAIVEPVRRQGAAYEPGLVARIIADVGDQPGALPLLQYTLTELFDRHVSGLIRTEGYEEIGGLTGALASRAEATFDALTADQRVAARRLFGRLVSLGEGTEDTRRRVRIAELGDDADTNSVVDAFGAARMLVFDVDPATREPTVEIAHEALLRAWPRLRGWLDEDRDGIRIHRHLTDTTAAWLASDRDPGELYRGGRLETAETWAADHRAEPNEFERDFLDASTAAHEAEEAAEREHLEQQVRSNRRLRVLASIAAVIALIAATAGAFALQQRSRADDQAAEAERSAEIADENAAAAELARADAQEEAERAETERIASLAASSATDDRQLALLLAVEAYSRAPSMRTMGSLQQVFAAVGPYLGVLGAGTPARGAFWVESDLVVTIGPEGVHSYDRTSGQRLATSPGPVVDLTSRRADGQVVTYALGASNATVGVAVVRTDDPSVLDVLDAATLRTRWVHDHGTVIDAVAVGPDMLATIDEHGDLRLFDGAGDLTAGPIAAHPETTLDQQVLPEPFVPLGRVEDVPVRARPRHAVVSLGRVVTSSGFHTKIWSATGNLLHEAVTGAEAFGTMFAFQPRAIAAGRSRAQFVWALESFVTIVDAASGAATSSFTADATTFNAGTPKIVAIEARDDGVWILTNDGRLTFQDATTGSVERSIELGLNDVGGFSLSPDGRAAVVAGREGTEIVSTAGDGLIATSNPGVTPMLLTIDSSGSYAAASTADPVNTAGDRVYAIEDGRLRDLNASLAEGQLSFPPSGRYLTNNTVPFAQVQLVDPATLEPVVTFENASGWTYGAGSASGDFYAFGELGSVGLFETTTGRRISSSEIVAESVNSVSFSADESHLLVGFNDRAPAILDVPGLKLVDEPLGDRPLRFAAYSADHSAVVTVGDDGRVRLHDPDTFELEVVLETSQLPTDSYPRIHLVAEGRLVLTTVNGDPQLYDRRTGDPVGGRFPNDPGVNFGGRTGVDRILTVVDGDLVLWDLDVDSWPDLACRAAGRNMTLDEWVRVGPGDPEQYRATCPQWPIDQ